MYNDTESIWSTPLQVEAHADDVRGYQDLAGVIGVVELLGLGQFGT